MTLWNNYSTVQSKFTYMHFYIKPFITAATMYPSCNTCPQTQKFKCYNLISSVVYIRPFNKGQYQVRLPT